MFKKLFKAFTEAKPAYSEFDLGTDFCQLIHQINLFDFKNYSDNQLKSHIEEYKKNFSIQEDLSISNFLAESYAITKEICRRVLGLEPYDSQLLTGIALHCGKIVELPTGEGKTLAAVFPVVFNALKGKGVHIFTFNDYLAKRDANWMKGIYEFWGLKVDYIAQWMDNKRRKTAYAADITYVTSKEAGFDYLRDTLVYSEEELVQRPFNFVVVDEADSILIDEARVPLVIAGNIANMHKIDKELVDIVARLKMGRDYLTDENKRNVFLTEAGINELENALKCGNLYDNNLELLTSINNLIHAQTLLKRDIDYIVRDNHIEIIDEFTGRVADKRKWHDGLQMAIEAIEGLDNTQNSRILGKIALQNFVSLYPKMSGMTATAKSSKEEFKDTYNKDVFVVEPHKKCIRVDYRDAIYTHSDAKYTAIINDIEEVHKTGRPILIGTGNIEESEILANLLKAKSINCVVLNAKNDDEEAEIIAKAGRLGTVTVSTNMAGRGVDIKLGEGDNSIERQKVVELGGLYVIGTNKNECLRIDNQLRGRAARQGDPGSTRFYVSLEDDILVKFGMDNVLPHKYKGLRQKEQINDNKLNELINHIQRVINGQNFEIRTTLGKYSLILEYQRRILSKKRTEILHNKVKSLLQSTNPTRYKSLCEAYGEERVAEIERKVSMHCIDECWYDFLEDCESMREGIELVNAGKKNPVDEYRKLVIEEFDKLYRQLEEKLIISLEATDFSMDANAIKDKGLHTPSSTWTYIINDNVKVKRFSLPFLVSSSNVYYERNLKRKIYMIKNKIFIADDVRGDAYNQLIDYAMKRCQIFVLVERNASELQEEGKIILEKLAPFLVKKIKSNAISGTILYSQSNDAYYYRCHPEAAEVLKASANSLFSWSGLVLEDLSFLCAENNLEDNESDNEDKIESLINSSLSEMNRNLNGYWLYNIAHEKSATLMIDEEERQLLSDSINGLFMRSYKHEDFEEVMTEALKHDVQKLEIEGFGIKELPEAICDLKQLKHLRVFEGWVSRLPKGISRLLELESLSLLVRDLEEIPKDIGALKNLKELEIFCMSHVYKDNEPVVKLERSGLSDIPEEIGELSDLENLSIGCTSIKKLPKSIGKLKKLKHLTLTNNLLCELPDEIAELSELESLWLDKNDLSEVPNSVEKLSKLKFVTLNNNNFNEIPEVLKKHPNLKHVSCESFEFDGFDLAEDESEV